MPSITVMYTLYLILPSLTNALISNVNVVIGRNASQSSTGWNGAAGRANDGNRNSHYLEHNSCTHTQQEDFPWWAADLKDEVQIGRVVIVNRGDGNADFLHDFHVGMMDVSPSSPLDPSRYSLCATYHGPAGPGEIIQLECTQVRFPQWWYSNIHCLLYHHLFVIIILFTHLCSPSMPVCCLI